jgi:DNA-binding CsgD family transcriptional regulator
LTHRLGYNGLCRDAQAVLSSPLPIERELQDDAGKSYLTRLNPYRSTEDRIEGIVVTFIDITDRKDAERLRIAGQKLATEAAGLRERYAFLTPREREVMQHVVRGNISKIAAAQIGIKEPTIKLHRARLMHKMGAQSVAELVRMAEKLNLLEES